MFRKIQRWCVSKLNKDWIIQLSESSAPSSPTTLHKKDSSANRQPSSCPPSPLTSVCQKDIATDRPWRSFTSLWSAIPVPKGRPPAQTHSQIRSKTNILVDMGHKSLDKAAWKTSKPTFPSSPSAKQPWYYMFKLTLLPTLEQNWQRQRFRSVKEGQALEFKIRGPRLTSSKKAKQLGTIKGEGETGVSTKDATEIAVPRLVSLRKRANGPLPYLTVV